MSYSGGSLFLLLVLTAIAAILLGTGLPTTATYLIVAILVAPALAKMGVPPLAAHLFVFYFGVISDLTPPTAVSCYVAAGIAKDSGMRVSFAATRIALPALVVPFMFVYSPALLMQGSWLDVLLVAGPALLGILAMSVALIGHLSGPLRPWQRMLAFAAGVMLIFPGWMTDLAGLTLLLIANAEAWLKRRRA
ncbi:MAG: TRAP transporter large permease subunit [Alphaproteobacteria bacterium]|nr:TRAP transporter large permease subunit [Alphaproteobacteria bacterium]